MAGSDLKNWDVYKDPLWLLHNLHRKYKVIRIPTNAGWTTNHVNGGASQKPFYFLVNTSVTANSRGLLNNDSFALNRGDITRYLCDWTKKLELEFAVARIDSDAQVIARFQLKDITTEGILAEKGIGIEINNFTMNGEAYGTARGTVAIGVLTNNRIARIGIVKTSASVEFWVNNVLAGALTGNAVPNVAAAAPTQMVVSIVNGAAGGVNAMLQVGNIQIVQEW